MESLRFLTPALAEEVRARFGTPVYVYDEATLLRQADAALAFPAPHELTVRYAVKACPNRRILQLFAARRLHFDCSSGFETQRALLAGIPADRITLSGQEMPSNLPELVQAGIHFTACSMHQLELFGQTFPGREVGVRFNPGLGSGGTNRTNTGGPASSFGVWHSRLDEVLALAEKYRLEIVRFHSHIGSGSDPDVWSHVVHLNIELVRRIPSVRILNLGGGFKVARISAEKATDLRVVGQPVREALCAFARETGRTLRLEIEPGTFLTANAGCLVATIQDVAHTGQDGYSFLKLDTGMTEILRPSLYGAIHALVAIPRRPTGRLLPYVVTGHCCESGDLLTPVPGEPEVLEPRMLAEVRIGDLLVIEGAGAYCAAMSAKNYNSFPEAPEALLTASGQVLLIRRRQELTQMIANEC